MVLVVVFFVCDFASVCMCVFLVVFNVSFFGDWVPPKKGCILMAKMRCSLGYRGSYPLCLFSEGGIGLSTEGLRRP